LVKEARYSLKNIILLKKGELKDQKAVLTVGQLLGKRLKVCLKNHDQNKPVEVKDYAFGKQNWSEERGDAVKDYAFGKRKAPARDRWSNFKKFCKEY